MSNRILLAASGAAAALSATPAVARPMTATDMQTMRRLGAPSVSPDGRYAVFSLSTTDLDANKRNNVLHVPDLSKPGSSPRPIADLAGAPNALFVGHGPAWVLATIQDQDHRFRIP